MRPRLRIRDFPLPYSIGTDICHIPRVVSLLKKDKGVFTVKLLRKILNQSEQRCFGRKMFVGHAIALRLGGVEDPLRQGPSQARLEPPKLDLKPEGELKWNELVAYFSNDCEAEKGGEWEELANVWRNMSEEKVDRNLTSLATWLAGRWAAKEAAIKAHTWRRLTMHDITIRRPRIWNGMTMAPEATVVAMDQIWQDVLQGEGEHDQTETLNKVDLINEDGTQPSQMEPKLQGRTDRPVEQQVKISISHDGDYATAVCIAAREEVRA